MFLAPFNGQSQNICPLPKFWAGYATEITTLFVNIQSKELYCLEKR